MHYNLLADTTAIIHITTVAAVLIGLLVCFRYKRFRPWEAGALIVIVVLWSYYGNCPLTILEEYFRTLAGNPSGITNVGFLPFYAQKFLGFGISSIMVQRTTFFTGGMFFFASLEWLSPFFHYELFRLRRLIIGSPRKHRKYARS
jgi:hypothetical protein